MPSLKSREIIKFMAAFSGIMVIADYFLVLPASLSSLAKNVVTWGLITANFAFVLGLVNMARLHARNILKRVPGQWYFSAVLLVALIVMMGIGIVLGQADPNYSWLFQNGLLPLEGTMYASLGFFIASGAFRAFKARGVDATILIGAAIVVMLTNAPVGEIIWSGFPIIGNWVMRVPVTAGMRGIIIGVAVGSLVYALRVITGKEARYAGVE